MAKKKNSYQEFLDRESRNPNCKDIFLYFCDYKRRIKDGKCDGTSCYYTHLDLAVNNNCFSCQHTSNENYAKNSSKRYFEIIPLLGDRDMFIEIGEEEISKGEENE